MDYPNEAGITALEVANRKESIARYSQNSDDGTAVHAAKSDLMLHGGGGNVPTNKAWQWTHNGYPLLINFVANTAHQDSDIDSGGTTSMPGGSQTAFEDPTGDLNA